jgi:hypothetical protein
LRIDTQSRGLPRLFSERLMSTASPCSQVQRRAVLAGTCAGLGTLLAGCASAPLDAGGDWHGVRLPGKPATRYRAETKGGRAAWAAQADRSASMWRRRVQRPADQVGEVAFSWWVDQLIDGANVADADREDAPARVLFGFGGDTARLSRRNRMMFELAHAVTGEAPPYATLMYVWESQAPVESVVINPRTDRVRKIVLDTGTAELGHWRDHRRHLAQDFRRAYGEAPGPLQSIALMTDADNTRSTAQAWYGPVRLL